VVVLLPVWYVGAWLTASKVVQVALSPRFRMPPLELRDTSSLPPASPPPGLIETNCLRIAPAFRPLVAYSASDMPGNDILRRLWWWTVPTFEHGSGSIHAPSLAFGPPLPRE
jgi:hypothetical protein